MKFIVSSAELLKHLSNINGVITTNPVVPILENFLFEIHDGLLTITASDLQISMTTEIDIEAKENESIAVPARILINSDNGRYKLAGENAIDFPKVPTVSDAYNMDISTDVLSGAINNTIFATSNDELRPAMTGVYLKLDETNTIFVATDGHRLVRYRRVDVASDTGMAIIIPRKALNLLKSTLPSENSNVIVEYNASNAYFHFNNIKMTCRLIDERFPDYENVIPTENPIEMRIDRNELLSSLKRISIYASKTTHQIRLKITGSELSVSAEDPDFSNEAKETLVCEHDGEDIEIGFNAKLLVELLANLYSKEITLQMSAPNRAGLIIPAEKDDNEDILMLVMPVMLNN